MTMASGGMPESRQRPPISVLRLWLAVMGVLLVLLGMCVYFLKYAGG